MSKLRAGWQLLSRNLGRVLASPTPWIFLLGVLAVGLMTEGLSKLFDVWLPDSATAALGTFVTGAVVVVIVLVGLDVTGRFRRWLASQRQGTTDVNVELKVPRKRGLVVLVSLGTNRSAEPAIRYHFKGARDEYVEPVLKYCWLLAGPGQGATSSRANAEVLEARYRAEGVNVTIWDLRDQEDPREVFRAVQDIYRLAADQYGLTPNDIIADFTGGTKSMTAGMVLACAAGDWDLQYMKPSKYTDDGRAAPDAVSLPRLVNVDFFTQDRDAA